MQWMSLNFDFVNYNLRTLNYIKVVIILRKR